MKITNINTMKALANTGVKCTYTRKNGQTRVGEFVSGTFMDALGETFITELAFVYDEARENATFVSKDLHEKDFEVYSLRNDKHLLEHLADKYKNNVVLFHATTTDEWILGRIATGNITTCLGKEVEKDLAFISFKPYGLNGRKDINSIEIWKKDIILVSTGDSLKVTNDEIAISEIKESSIEGYMINEFNHKEEIDKKFDKLFEEIIELIKYGLS